MKYAFLLGSNAFLVSKPVISYVENGEVKDLIRLNHLYDENSAVDSALSVDTDFTLPNGYGPLKLTGNLANGAAEKYHVKTTGDQLLILGAEDAILFDVHQLRSDAIGGLSSHVINELNWHEPYIAIRIRGEFLAGQHEIIVDNEKLFVDGESYAETVHVGDEGLMLSSDGVRP